MSPKPDPRTRHRIAFGIAPTGLFAALLLASTGGVSAEDTASEHAGHAAHATHGAGGSIRETELSTPLLEPGQGAFAALSEAVAALTADPRTDWSRVDIDGLRGHLLQMDALITDTVASARATEKGTEFTVRGDGRALAAIHAMVPAHAAVLRGATDWSTEVTLRDDGAILRVGAEASHERARIAALGFYGVMATGDHHREHHWAMARGEQAHAMPGH